MVLDLSVGKYRGFALLAISMTGESLRMPISGFMLILCTRPHRVYRSDPCESPLDCPPHFAPFAQRASISTTRPHGLAELYHLVPTCLSLSSGFYSVCALGRLDRPQPRMGRMGEFRSNRELRGLSHPDTAVGRKLSEGSVGSPLRWRIT
jgi:hypothetical protein